MVPRGRLIVGIANEDLDGQLGTDGGRGGVGLDMNEKKNSWSSVGRRENVSGG